MSRPKVEAEHGTLTRYRQYPKGETPCQACKDVYNASVTDRKKATSRKASTITSRALLRLRRLHPEDFKRIRAEEAADYAREQAEKKAQADAEWAAVFAGAADE